MNTDQMKGNWKQFIGTAKEKWGQLTDDDWKVVEGKRDQLVGRIQQRYGIAREEAELRLLTLKEATRGSSRQSSRCPASRQPALGLM